MRCFSEHTPESTIHFQVVDLGRQVYVWVGDGGPPKLGNLYTALKGPAVSEADTPRRSLACQGSAFAWSAILRSGHVRRPPAARVTRRPHCHRLEH